MVRHVLKVRPRHDLEETSVDRRWNAVWRSGNRERCYTGRMEVVQVDACQEDLLELRERVSPFRHPCFVWRQVAGDNVWTNIISITWCIEARGESRTEVCASCQVSGRVGFLRLAKVRVETRSEIEVGRAAGGVTEVAIGDRIHPITAQPDQVRVFSLQIQRDGGDFETQLDA